MKNGFTIVELLVVIALIALLAGVGGAFASYMRGVSLDACAADLKAHAQMSFQLEEQMRPYFPDQNLMYQWAKNRKPHYHYIPNNSDLNKGHGNDLDLCDEENPGASLDKRECLDIKWVWVCDHDHGDAAKYVFVTSELDVWVVPSFKEAEREVLTRDLHYWSLKDPKLQKWIGR